MECAEQASDDPGGALTASRPAHDAASRDTDDAATRDADDAATRVAPDLLVVVQFKGHRKSYYHNRRGISLAVDQYCLVEADRGRDLGRVTYIGPGKESWWRVAARQGVLAAASPLDLEKLAQNRGDEWEYWDIAQEKIQARRLHMNLVTVERQFDGNKITFYFTAEQRVDFRELVRDLAAVFRTRIELRQIGVRDEARLKGGMGICGREFCCATFLHEFIPVTLKMAKEQQMPLNPGKLSGLCGRLRCCLTFEHASYREALQSMPRVGCRIQRNGDSGIVRKLDPVRRLVTFQGDDGELQTSDPSELVWERERQEEPNRHPPRRKGGGGGRGTGGAGGDGGGRGTGGARGGRRDGGAGGDGGSGGHRGNGPKSGG
ncbi:MAG: stage 0 sporulation family protein [Candidatus Krumholzibacteriia bacterium]